MGDFKTVAFAVEGKRSGNPEFDPDLHTLTPANSFWIRFREPDGSTIAFIAARLINTNSLRAMAADRSLWYGDTVRFNEPLDLISDEDDPVLSGRIVLDGSMWVDPSYRGRAYSWCLSRMLRCVSCDLWDPDHYFGFSLTGLAKSRLPIYSYGYASIDHFARDYLVPGLPRFDLYVTPLSRQQALAQFAMDLAFLQSSPDLVLDQDFSKSLKQHGVEVADEIGQIGNVVAAS
ncbi:MAG: hypothetical protein AAF414_13160 [Pseudomonadota bacterium]